jgi:transcriptional regulator with PAS, ATPase and Fis domain
MPADLLEAEFRSADGGTICLDEVAELPPALQVKLLRLLEDHVVRPVGSVEPHGVDVRIIAATNRQVEPSLRDGTLRRDLHDRLNVARITMPPLRERLTDIPALVTHFVRRLNQRFNRDVHGVTPDAMAALAAYDYPGNVRELDTMLERAYALGARREITLAELPALPARPDGVRQAGEMPTLAEVERELILRALTLHGNDKDRTAKAIGLSRRTIYRRLKDYGAL